MHGETLASVCYNLKLGRSGSTNSSTLSALASNIRFHVEPMRFLWHRFRPVIDFPSSGFDSWIRSLDARVWQYEQTYEIGFCRGQLERKKKKKEKRKEQENEAKKN